MKIIYYNDCQCHGYKYHGDAFAQLLTNIWYIKKSCNGR